MKSKRSRGLFDEEFRLEKISKQKDPLMKLKGLINWDQFREILEEVFKKESRGQGGRPNYDYVMMFKILILQRYYNLSDDQTEYQILDRLSFMRFLDLGISDNVPDSKTIWNYREQLTKAGANEKLFVKFSQSLEKAGLMIHEGSIVDASFVEVAKQNNSREENKQIKEGIVPESWKEKPNKLSQKDIDARWTKKNFVNYYGYKDHVKVGIKSKLIESYGVTDASVHDLKMVESLIDQTNEGKDLYGDSAYNTIEVGKFIESQAINNRLHEKGCKHRKLTDEQRQNNKAKSKIRARVEHVFGFIENSMGGSFIRCIGKKRAEAVIGLINLVYNMFRSIQLQALTRINVAI